MTCGNVDLGCTKCRLSEKRTRVVPGAGPCNARIIFVGEAPGRDEDLMGQPFVGRAGRILDEALQEAGVDRSQVYISNLVKCRPPKNRRPRKSEVVTCTSLYLESEIKTVSPLVICALGQTAAEALMRTELNMEESVGKEFPQTVAARNVRLFVAYHPAACLYQRRNLPRFKETIRACLLAAGLTRS
jgi:DNA polymerase